jgi:hypothetical protein
MSGECFQVNNETQGHEKRLAESQSDVPMRKIEKWATELKIRHESPRCARFAFYVA